MFRIGLFVGSLFGLMECLWISSGPDGWSGLGRALLTIVLLYALTGAALALVFTWCWRRLPVDSRRSIGAEGAVFVVLFASAFLFVDLNRFIPEGALEARSLMADVVLAACTGVLLAGIFRLTRPGEPVGAIGRPARFVSVACGLCAGLVLAWTSANAWKESERGFPIARMATQKAPPTWEFPPVTHMAAAVPLGAGETKTAHPAHPKLVVIGLDGATWSVMRPLMDRGRLPHLEALLRTGIGGVLRSTDDAFSPIVWTTLLTGKVPARHGIDGIETTRSVNRRVRALWNMLSDRGEKVLAVNVPGSYPAEAIRGVMLAGFPNESETGNNLGHLYTTRTESPDPLSGLAVEPLEAIAASGDAPIALRIRERSPLPRQSAIVSAIERATDTGAQALEGWLLKTYATFDLRRTAGGLRFDLRGCEDCGFDLESGWSPWIFIQRQHRPLAFRLRLIEATTEATSIYVTPLFLLDWERQMYPAEVGERLAPIEGPYLTEGSGWLHFRNPRLLAPLAEHLFGVARDRARYVTRLWRSEDWEALIDVLTLTDRVQHSYWSFLDRSEFPDIALPGPYPRPFPDGIRREDYADVIPQAYEWADRKIGMLLDGLPSSTLVAVVSDHGFRSGASRIPGSGVHDPDGVYILNGPGLAPSRPPEGSLRADGPTLNLVDFLPTVLPLVGMPTASDFDGIPAPFVEEVLARRNEKIVTIPSFESPSKGRPRRSTRRDKGAIDQLRSLGYVE